VNARGRVKRTTCALFHVNTQHSGRSDRLVAIDEENQLQTVFYKPQFHPFLADRTLEVCLDGLGAVFGMTANADYVSPQTFDVVVAILGLYIDQGTAIQVVEVDDRGLIGLCCHERLRRNRQQFGDQNTNVAQMAIWGS
jgi:hypothetical protein